MDTSKPTLKLIKTISNMFNNKPFPNYQNGLPYPRNPLANITIFEVLLLVPHKPFINAKI